MTSGAKVEFGSVRRNRPSSATDNCVDEAQLQLCYFAPLPELCSQKSNLLSCVARKAAVICSHCDNYSTVQVEFCSSCSVQDQIHN